MDGNIGSNLENATTPGESCMGEKEQTWSLVTKIAHFNLDIFMIFSTGVFLRRSYLINLIIKLQFWFTLISLLCQKFHSSEKKLKEGEKGKSICYFLIFASIFKL